MASDEYEPSIVTDNLARVAIADKALRSSTDLAHDTDGETALADLIGHLLHWANVQGVDFDQALARGRRYYDDEVAMEAAWEADHLRFKES